MTTKTKVTKKQAENVLKTIRFKYGVEHDDPTGPKLIMDWEWSTLGKHPAVVWEEGPHEWACDGHWRMFDDVFVEAITNWSLGIFTLD